MAPPCITTVTYGPDVLNWDADAGKLLQHVHFPIGSKSDLRIQTIYAMDDTTVKWHEHLLSVEAVIYGVNDPEDEVARITNILNTPGLQLKCSAVGIGAIPTINVSQDDPTNGPFSQELIVTPFGANDAIFIKWTVKFCTSECVSLGDERIMNMAARLSMDIDEDGDVILSAEGEIEFEKSIPVNALPILLSVEAGVGNPVVRGVTWKTVHHSEPNGRTLKYRTQSIPIKSENPFFEGTRNVEVTQEVSSSLFGKSHWDGKGFYTWKNTFSGEITLPPEVDRSWAWSVFLRIVRQRNRRMALIGLDEKTKALIDAVPADSTLDANKPYFLPLKYSLKEQIYSRKLSFRIDYMLVTSLDRLIQNSGLFTRVNNDYPALDEDVDGYTPAKLSDQWKDWQADYNARLNPYAYRYGPLPIVFSCGAKNLPGPKFQHYRYQNTFENDSTYPGAAEDAETYQNSVFPPGGNSLDKKLSWNAYEQTFIIYENTKTMPVNYLSPGDPTHYQINQSAASNTNNNDTGWTLYNKAVNQSATRNVSYRGPSNYIVRMIGHAVRVGYSIPAPSIVSIAGSPAVRTGQPKWMHSQIAQSEQYPVYMAAWDVPYLLTTELSGDILSSLMSNGLPSQYL